MNFYDLKTLLHMPQMGGAIRRKEDVFALLSLHEEQILRIDELMKQTSLNRNEANGSYTEGVWQCLMMLYKMHQWDIKTIKKYLKENRMVL